LNPILKIEKNPDTFFCHGTFFMSDTVNIISNNIVLLTITKATRIQGETFSSIDQILINNTNKLTNSATLIMTSATTSLTSHHYPPPTHPNTITKHDFNATNTEGLEPTLPN
jgi:hypothetical protein